MRNIVQDLINIFAWQAVQILELKNCTSGLSTHPPSHFNPSGMVRTMRSTVDLFINAGYTLVGGVAKTEAVQTCLLAVPQLHQRNRAIFHNICPLKTPPDALTRSLASSLCIPVSKSRFRRHWSVETHHHEASRGLECISWAVLVDPDGTAVMRLSRKVWEPAPGPRVLLLATAILLASRCTITPYTPCLRTGGERQVHAVRVGR